MRGAGVTCAALVSMSLAGCGPSKPPVAVVAPTGHWISLFNGNDLNRWTPKIAGQELGSNYQHTFRVENHLLRVTYADYDGFGDRFGSLYYSTPYSRYWLRAEYRFTGDLAKGAPGWARRNSGIQLQSQSPQSMRLEQQFPVSVELDLVGGSAWGSRPTGDVCHYGTQVKLAGATVAGLCSKVSDVTIRGDEWVTVLAEVDGAARVRHVVNGLLVVEYSDLTLDDSNPDAHRLLEAGAPREAASGYISIQSNGAPIEFRRIELLPIT